MTKLAPLERAEARHLKIRPAKSDDHLALYAMIHALAAHHGDEATVNQRELATLLTAPNPPLNILIATLSGTPVGYAALRLFVKLHLGARILDIDHLFVAAPFRRQGIGRALIAAAEEQARERGCQSLTIGTDPANVAAQAAYRAIGFDERPLPGPRFRKCLD
ncbi:MAG: GNAT family N-acetyltransferase [Pseudomonadota bacterium]